MAVGADIAVDVEIVEQDEFARQLVEIGREVLAEEDQRRVAVAFFHVAQHLIVAAILLDDVDDVLDVGERARAGPVSHRGRASWRGCVAVKVLSCSDGEGLDPRRGAGLHAADVLYGGRRGCAGMHRFGAFGGVGTVLGVGVGAEPFAVEDDQGSVGESAHGGGIPAGGDEAFDAAARFGDIDDGGGVGVGAGHEEAFAIGAEAEGGRRHAQGLARGHGDVDALHHADVLGGGDAEGEHVIGIGGGDEDARGVGRRFAGGGFRRALAPQHIAGMGADAHGLPDQAAAGGIVLAERAIGPVGDEEGLAIGVEENAVGAAAGLELADHHAGLRIDHRDAIAIEVGGVEQAAVGREGHVADEILRAALRLRHRRRRSARG